MKTIIEYLDDLKEKTGSDYKAAKKMNIDKSVISNIRRRQLMSDETAIKVADALGVNRSELLIAAAIARSGDSEVKKSWENISKLSGIAASVAIACILSGSEMKEAGLSANNQINSLYIMRSL